MKYRYIIPLLPLCLAVSCSSKGTRVEPDNDPGHLGEISYIATDVNDNLKRVDFIDTLLSTGDSATIMRETGVETDYSMSVVFRNMPWQAVYCVRSDIGEGEGSGELTWIGNHVEGHSEIDGSHHDIDTDVNDFSIHGWFLFAGFLGLPFDDDGWFFDFDLIAPELGVYGFRAEYVGVERVHTPGGSFDCHKLEVDARGAYGIFAPDIHIFCREAKPHIPIRCWVEDMGIVFEFHADSL